MSIHDLYDFQARVRYAAQCLKSPNKRLTHSNRRFDTCFEMYDGTQVVVALVRRADKDPALQVALPKEWFAMAARFADLPDWDLPKAAQKAVEQGKAQSITMSVGLILTENNADPSDKHLGESLLRLARYLCGYVRDTDGSGERIRWADWLQSKAESIERTVAGEV